MAGISFSVFKDKILSGAKRQTIRAVRKHPIKEGELLYMWWKQRSPECEKLGEAICSRATPIEITKNNFTLPYIFASTIPVLNAFAIADGFDNWQKLVEFFDDVHGLPFVGVLIEWDSIKSPFQQISHNLQAIAKPAFFFKQAGSNPYYFGKPVKLGDRNGEDLSDLQIPEIIKVREFPIERSPF